MRWAKNDEISSSGIFEAVQTDLTVRLIMTPRDQLMTCNAEDQSSIIVSNNTERYDYIPVLGSELAGERISGLFHAAQFYDDRVPEGCIRDHFVPLTEEYLIGADAKILDFITDADTNPCRLVLLGARISGLVSLSDLQKLPVRASLFALITGLEMTMAEAIRKRFSADEEWLGFLSPKRQKNIRNEISVSKSRDNFVDPLLFTQFADKKTIIKKGIDIGLTKSGLEHNLKRIQKLRDKIAHANDYAASPDEAREACAIIRELLTLREKIAEAAQ